MAARSYAALPLSDAALARIDAVSAAHFGRRSDAELARAVTALSEAYTRSRGRLGELEGTRDALYARLGFFFARDLPKVFGPLGELSRLAQTPLGARRVLRLLDVGAGLGATALGVARFLRLRALPVERLEIVALERNPAALPILRDLVRTLSELTDEFVPCSLEVQNVDLEQVGFREPFDLVTFGFVLNELFACSPEQRREKMAQLLEHATRRVGSAGATLVLEPALRETTRELMAMRDAIAARDGAPFVVAPCLHDLPCPMLPSERDWCHQELAFALPPRLAAIARAASLRYEGLSYASLVLANQRPALLPNAYRVVSDRLESKGKLELFGCSASGYVRLSRLNRHQSAHNSAFSAAQRGDVVTLEGNAPRIDASTVVTKRT